MLKTETQQINNCLVMRLTGDLHEEDTTVIQGKLLSLCSQKSNRYAVDLGQLSEIPLNMTVALVTLRSAIKKFGEPLILINIPSDFRFILQVARIDHLFHFIPSTEYLTAGQSSQPNREQPAPPPQKPVIYDVLQKDKQQS